MQGYKVFGFNKKSFLFLIKIYPIYLFIYLIMYLWANNKGARGKWRVKKFFDFVLLSKLR